MISESQTASGLIFVEDPGAVNCIMPIVEALSRSDFPPVLIASGHAVKMLKERGVCATQVDMHEKASDLIARIDPQWVLVGTSENLDTVAFDLVEAARKSYIHTIGIVDSSANVANRFRGKSDSPLTYAPDSLFLPDEWTAEAFASLGYPKNRLLVVGHPHYDYVRKSAEQLVSEGRINVRNRIFPEQAKARRVVVFASEISSGLDSPQYQKSAKYTLNGRGESNGRTEIVIEEFLDAICSLVSKGLDRPFLVLRRHPKETDEHLKAYVSEFDHISSGPGALELLYAADLVVGMSSMLLLEAFLLKTAVVSILPRDIEKNWLPILRTDDVPVVTSTHAIHEALSNALSMRGNNLELKKVNDKSVNKVVNSTDRIIHFLNTIGSDS